MSCEEEKHEDGFDDLQKYVNHPESSKYDIYSPLPVLCNNYYTVLPEVITWTGTPLLKKHDQSKQR